MNQKDIQDLYQTNSNFKAFVDHWSAKHNVTADEILSYEITRLYAIDILEKEKEIKNETEEIKYELHQDNGI